MSQLGDIIKRIRTQGGGAEATSLSDFAQRVEKTRQFIGQVERGEKAISEKLAYRIAERFALGEEERNRLLAELLAAIATFRAPEIAGALRPDDEVRERPPPEFPDRVRRDLAHEQRLPDDVAQALQIPPTTFRRFLDGECSLARSLVVELARLLRRDDAAYLLAAGFLPDDLRARLHGLLFLEQQGGLLLSTPLGKDIRDRYGILYVDSDGAACEQFVRHFSGDFHVDTVPNATAAEAALEKDAGHTALVIAEQALSGPRGTDLLANVASRWPLVVRLLTSAELSTDAASEAVNRAGVFHYVRKPWNVPQLKSVLGKALQHFLIARERDEIIRLFLRSASSTPDAR